MFIKNKITAVPKELRRTTILLVIIGGFVTITFDMFAFLLQFGKDAISGAESIYGYQSNYFIVELHVEPTEGTQIKIPGQKKFTVDGVDYMFDRDYTFTYSNGTWTVA